MICYARKNNKVKPKKIKTGIEIRDRLGGFVKREGGRGRGGGRVRGVFEKGGDQEGGGKGTSGLSY